MNFYFIFEFFCLYLVHGSPAACVKEVFRREGLNGFYRGITPTLCRDVLPFGIYMATYDVCLDIIEHTLDAQKRESVFKRSHNGAIVVAGSVAGLLSWLFVVPFDVVKTKMQLETNPSHHPTMFSCGVEVFKVRIFKINLHEF